jgi:uncharacterized protein YbcC (UPF0753/DUF2309 family)
MKKSNIISLVEASCKRVAPAWPLKNFVAVNPFIGFADKEFSDTAKSLATRGGVRMTMPISFYLQQIELGTITTPDLIAAFKKHAKDVNAIGSFIKKSKQLNSTSAQAARVDATLTGIASKATDKDWNAFMVNKISEWATSYFDECIALWNTSEDVPNIYNSWKNEAQIDLSPELMGLKGFRALVKTLPEDHREAITAILTKLKLPEENVEGYVHSVLLKTIGWSSYIAGLDYTNAIYAKEHGRLHQFLAILLTWELYFLEAFGKDEIKAEWYKKYYSEEPESQLFIEKIEAELVLQDAYDFASQRELKHAFDKHQPVLSKDAVKAQMIFCIDVRSEVYRRNLETVDKSIETIGFAGFFGFPINYLPLGHSEGKNQCPVLIPSTVMVKESISNDYEAIKTRKTRHQIEETWKIFKSGPVTSFGFVSCLGLTFLPKLILNSTGLTRPIENPKQDGLKKWMKAQRILDLSSITLEEKVAMASGALTGMGIKDNLAPLVLISGHGSTSVNNPHASGLDCGACGGHSGEVNALTAQQILNEPEVRNELAKGGIHIPKETLFVACLHDTTTDEVEIINEQYISERHKKALQEVKASLTKASRINRVERSKRLNLNTTNADQINGKVLDRSRDWAQVRPEWGLAGCNAFVIAPRALTLGLDLKGKSFLQSYNPNTDIENQVLESIMTAPMVVTSWINLQYYASTVDNQHFGAGNKTLHNVAGGVGVLEGSGGDLRIGLPLQSVRVGDKLEHLPQRLNVIINAPLEAINSILVKHEGIKQLCDHSWIMLLKLDDNGKISHRYTKDCQWEMIDKSALYGEKKELATI